MKLPSLGMLGHGIGLSAAALLIFAIARPLYLDWSAAKQKEHEKAEAASVGTDASITAAFLLKASTSCSAVGVPKLPDCAEHPGPLIEDTAAAEVAKMALDQYNQFQAKCKKYSPADYCDALMERALVVRRRSNSTQP